MVSGSLSCSAAASCTPPDAGPVRRRPDKRLSLGERTGHHRGVARSRMFKPGHPVIFWMFIVVLIFAFYTGAKAMATKNDCDSVSQGVKHWIVVPGEWVCTSGRVQFSK